MVLNKVQRFKVLLMLSAYLCVVLTHLQFIEPAHVAAKSPAYVAGKITPKGYDKTGHVILIKTKIYKTVINRKLDPNQAPHYLYATTLLFNHTAYAVNGLKLSTYTTPAPTLQIKRGFYLRI
jgi:hypothetical protein